MTTRSVWGILWWLFAGLLDQIRHVGAGAAGLVVIVILLLAAAGAWGIQRMLVFAIRSRPDGKHPLLLAELLFSVAGVVVGPILVAMGLGRALARAFQPKRETAPSTGAASEGSPPQETASDEKPDANDKKPIVVATIGPSFLVAGFATAGLLLTAKLTAPLARAQLDLPAGVSPWEYLALGWTPSLGWYLPLDRYPYLGATVLVLAGTWFWWTTARVVRVVWAASLSRNLNESRRDSSVLSWSRRYLGAPDLWQPEGSFLSWAKWLSIVALPLFGFAWLGVEAVPYRVDAAVLAVSLCLWLGWTLNLLLRGHADPEQKEEDNVGADQATQSRPGWRDVFEELEKRHGVERPAHAAPPRRVPALFEGGSAKPPGLIGELVPNQQEGEQPRVTRLQRDVLERLAKLGYVHVSPPSAGTTLTLGQDQPNFDDTARGQIVLAPEGCGKTTLGLLAAFQHVLLHSTSVLFVLPNARAADAVESRMRQTVERSTLRWNLRIRRCSDDLVDDLAEQILPDIVIASLEDLVTGILGRGERLNPLLLKTGFVIVDDVDALVGPLEVHAQPAFRRLNRRLETLLGTRAFAGKNVPILLALGAPGVDDMEAWARSVLDRELRAARFFPDTTPHQGGPDTDGTSQEPLQIFLRLCDMRNASGDPITVQDVVTACEVRGVPWHHRSAGDERRPLGREVLRLATDPSYWREDPAEAAVVFVEGSFGPMQRELDRLARAGCQYVGDGSEVRGGDGIVAMIRVVDADEDTVFTQLDERAPLTAEIKALPRAALRAPAGATIEAHMASELGEGWMEVGDVRHVFGPGSVLMLRRLAGRELLVTRERTEVAQGKDEFERLVDVRVLQRAISDEDLADADRADKARCTLPPRVCRVSDAAVRRLALRDITSSSLLKWVDAASASLVYYPGRVFEAQGGRYVVSGRAGIEADASSSVQGGILVEPFAEGGHTSPRRRTRVTVHDPMRAGATEGGAATSPLSTLRHPMLLGDEPIDVEAAPILCATEHVGTLRVDNTGVNVVQKRWFPPDTPERKSTQVATFGLLLYPCSRRARSATGLDLGAARLIAAAMRMVLRSMYRDAPEAMAVGLHLVEQQPEPDHMLGPMDAFVLYELAEYGNGSTRALARDGIDLLLRLSRLTLERVLRPDALIHRYDEWADDRELTDPSWPLADKDRRIAFFQEARPRALTWLDARLRREGSVRGGSDMVHLPGTREPGEGDSLDLGRAWFAEEGHPRDLLWTRHSWRGPSMQEAFVDYGLTRAAFDARSRLGPLQGPNARVLDEYLARTRNEGLPGRAEPVDIVERTDSGGERLEAVPSGPVPALHGAIVAALLDAWPLVRSLGARLTEGEEGSGTLEDAPRDVAMDRMVGLVQSLASPDLGANPLHIADALVRREADPVIRAGLLAALLRGAGMDGGAFLSDEGEVLGAIGIPVESLPPIGDGGSADPAAQFARSWTKAGERRKLPPIVAVRAVIPGARQLLYVPVELDHPATMGAVRVERPGRWWFAPMIAAWVKLGLPPEAPEGL
jgi:hypothetical protein